jgi:acyl phosphate:glycerol-3-phosphate acyltransferase
MYNGIIAVIIAYLLGSIPTAYIITRITTGKDIRKLGSGNVGAHNVYENVGKPAAVITAIIDIGKGIAAVLVAFLGFGAPQYWVLASGLAVVIGHIWPVFLKFRGGNGIAATIGVLSFLMTKELLISIAVMILVMVFTRNLVLSVNTGLLVTIPIASIFVPHMNPWIDYFVFSLLLIVLLVSHFIPTMKAAMVKAGGRQKLAAELMRIEPEKPAKKKKKKR